MPPRAGEVLFSIRAELNQLRADMREINRTFSTGFDGITAMAKNFGAALGASLSVGAVVSFGKSIVDLGDKLSDLSDITGLSVETLGGIRVAVEQNGTSLEAFANGILRAQRNLGDLEGSGKEAAQAMKALGLNAKEMASLNTDQFLERLAEALSKVENRNERAAAATKILGRAGAELLPTVLQLAENGIPKLDRATADAYRSLGRLKDQLVVLTAAVADFSAKVIANFGKQLGVIPQSVEEIEKAIAHLKQFAPGDIGTLNKLMADLEAAKARVAKEGAAKGGGVLANLFPPEGKKRVDETRNAVQSFTDSLEKQADQLRINIVALGAGEQAALELSLAFQLAEARSKFLAEGKTPPADLETKFAALSQEILTLSGNLATAKIKAENLKQELEDLDKVFPEPGLEDITSALPPDLLAKSGAILTEDQFRDLLKLEKELKNQTIVLDDFKGKTDEVTIFVERSFERMTDAIGDGMKDLLSGQIRSWEDFGRRIVSVISDITAEWLAMQAKIAIFGPEFGSRTGGGGQIGGLVGSLVGLAGGLFGGGAAIDVSQPISVTGPGSGGLLFPNPRQHGGPVWPGQQFLVGEAGPEIFRPMTSGTINPLNRHGGPPVIFTMNVSTPDAGSFRQSGNQIQADMFRMMSTASKRLGMQRD